MIHDGMICIGIIQAEAAQPNQIPNPYHALLALNPRPESSQEVGGVGSISDGVDLHNLLLCRANALWVYLH